ncbi:nuclear transport factor 2 family protein [Mameliella alba]|uniref:SnoaL-like domain-containing protein n=1 Tax=Mameliella alba TaxID=561184 RepID=A0A0B3RPV7_9RHOB|nr:nuclear transport factor 2 family protein [Mameliella alba]KHQ49842.1 hypothetical protein OA50_05623 [Mameliella alba]MBY6120468.1 nuclear transport factor 2 family protein [Mameliella alba]OWV60717.1 nuclear transport factor 2 family protein [Mameliella alba]
MTQIQGSKDCGNSPKNKFVQDVAVSLECGDLVPSAFSEDVIWEHPPKGPILGREAVIEALGARPKPSTVIVQHAISHGKVGAASGEVAFANGNPRRFCHVFEFTNAKANCVATVRSYS